MKKLALLFIIYLSCLLSAKALGSTGDWTCSVALDGYVSSETGKAPNAYMWVDEACEEVRFVVLAQQNMTEEALLRNASFRKEMARLGGALIWVAPWFSHSSRLHLADKARGELQVDYICGPVRKVGKDTFEIIPYDCGDDNPRRSHSAWLVAVGEGNKEYKRVVQPIWLKLW